VKLPRDLSGRDLVRALVRRWGYRRVNQVGSHVILQTDDPFSPQIVSSNHAVLGIGTLNAILRAVAEAKQVRREDIISTLQ
jgi:predicted RNA binding protein YcfA (HicA-like mRNA interferase family)